MDARFLAGEWPVRSAELLVLTVTPFPEEAG